MEYFFLIFFIPQYLSKKLFEKFSTPIAFGYVPAIANSETKRYTLGKFDRISCCFLLSYLIRVPKPPSGIGNYFFFVIRIMWWIISLFTICETYKLTPTLHCNLFPVYILFILDSCTET